MTVNKGERKTISLPLDVHEKASEASKRAGMKQYEFIASAVELALLDNSFFNAIIELHKKRLSFESMDATVKKRLESLSAAELEQLLNALKPTK